MRLNDIIQRYAKTTFKAKNHLLFSKSQFVRQQMKKFVRVRVVRYIMCPIKIWNAFFLSFTSARLISNVRRITRVRLVFGVVLSTTLITVMDGVCVTHQNAHLLKVSSNQFLPLSKQYYLSHMFKKNNYFSTTNLYFSS